MKRTARRFFLLAFPRFSNTNVPWQPWRYKFTKLARQQDNKIGSLSGLTISDQLLQACTAN
ncbi:hypothetical protein [Nitrosospira sp. Nsp1]|uniref:hypothetical protein n=1 Tax=Nitrosospira sp. Nsp1 TaxID=136547 RepID=UPI000B815E22|nr:hypothetical protein [Nitrosospira sp. Nsp1]